MLQIAAIDVGRQPELGVVDQPDELLLIGPRDNGCDRTEDLLGDEAGVHGDVGDHQGGEEIALGVLGQGGAVGDPGAGHDRFLDLGRDVVDSLLADQGADGGAVGGGTDGERLHL